MTMTDDDPKDPKVKALVERDPSQPLDQFVDAATAAQLERWFGLPSFAQVESGEVEGVPVEENPDDEFAEIRERRRKLLADVDHALLERIEQRHTPRDGLFQFAPSIDPITVTLSVFDAAYAESRATISDERNYERPDYVIEALAENAPQALLRDLHRLDVDFTRTKDDDWDMEERPAPEPFLVDLVAQIDELMAKRFHLEPVATPDVAHLMDDMRSEINQSWVDIANSGRLYNRRVTE